MDSYAKLRPWTAIESCQCPKVEGLFLVDLLTDNPLHCDMCRNEVDPERIKLTAQAIRKGTLIDPKGQVNRDGLEVARTLSMRIPSRLLFFDDTDDDLPESCPICQARLDQNVKWGIGKCPNCPIRI